MTHTGFDALQPSTLSKMIREVLDNERSRRNWALRNHVGTKARKVKEIDTTLAALDALTRQAEGRCQA